MRRLLIPSALALLSVAAVVTLTINLVGDVYNAYVYMYASLGYEEWTYENNMPRGVWMGPYDFVELTTWSGRSFIFYAAATMNESVTIYLNDAEFKIDIDNYTTYVETAMYKITRVAQNATHMVFKIEAAVPDVYRVEIEPSQYVYVKFP
jgi:hypothetical protein